MTPAVATAGLRYRGRSQGWLALARVVWVERQRALMLISALAAALALAIIVTEMQLTGVIGSGPYIGSKYAVVGNYLADNGAVFTALANALRALPVVVGMFLGAPLLARELESGSFRFSWTQSVGRRRQVGATLLVLGVAVAALGVLLGLLQDWLSHPFELTGEQSQWYAGSFETSPVILSAWSVTGLFAGTFIGGLARRQVAAVAATGAVLGAAWIASILWFLPHLLSIHPAVTAHAAPVQFPSGVLKQPATPGSGRVGSWLVYGQFVGPHDRPVPNATILRLLQAADNSGSTRTFFASHHIGYQLSFQPASRFWIFQGAELVALSAISCLLVFGTMRLIRRG